MRALSLCVALVGWLPGAAALSETSTSETMEAFQARWKPKLELLEFQGAVQKELGRAETPSFDFDGSIPQAIEKWNEIVREQNRKAGPGVTQIPRARLELSPRWSEAEIAPFEALSITLHLSRTRLGEVLDYIMSLGLFTKEITFHEIRLLPWADSEGIAETKQYVLPRELSPATEPLKSALKNLLPEYPPLRLVAFDAQTKVLTLRHSNFAIEVWELWYARYLEHHGGAGRVWP